MRGVGSIAAILFVLAGCAWVEQADERTITIGVGDVGEIAPGLRRPLSFPEARRHCARFGKEATLIDLREKTATWRCDPPS